jgi:hypothetical protein
MEDFAKTVAIKLIEASKTARLAKLHVQPVSHRL